MSFNVRAKILISVAIPIAALIVFTLVQLVEQRENLLQGRKAGVRQIVEVAISLLDHYHTLADKGLMSDGEARERAKTDLRDLRFDGKNFIVAYQTDGTLEVLAPDPHQEGKSLIDARDPNGVAYVRQDIEIAKAGGGFGAYSAPRKAGEPAMPKISAILPYKPWDLLVVAGVYIDDIDASFHQQLLRV